MNLPNAITIGRIFLVPLLVVVLMTNQKDMNLFGVSKEILGALIFAVASLTDWLDGYVARRRKQVTALGQFIAVSTVTPSTAANNSDHTRSQAG